MADQRHHRAAMASSPRAAAALLRLPLMSAAARLQQFVRSLRSAPAHDEGSPALWREGVARLFADVDSWLSWVSPPDGSVERISLADVEALCVTLKGREF